MNNFEKMSKKELENFCHKLMVFVEETIIDNNACNMGADYAIKFLDEPWEKGEKVIKKCQFAWFKYRTKFDKSLRKKEIIG